MTTISGIKTLGVLTLHQCEIPENAFMRFNELAELHTLICSETVLCDDDLKSIAKIPTLSYLQTVRGKLSDGAIAAFRKATPRISIWVRP